jgi:hypothetical protein
LKIHIVFSKGYSVGISVLVWGVVHTFVHQKLVKSSKITSFNQCPEYEFQTLYLRIQTHYKITRSYLILLV